MNGVLIIDKPQGVTSFDMVRKARRWCGTRRVGHSGTLDPLATGVLPVAVGWATRLVEYMMEGQKTYRATLKLGAATDTQDSEGQVISEGEWRQVERAAIEGAIASFVGEIEQLPPMFSALKKDGQPLYKLARQGIEVERTPRSVCIEHFDIEEFTPPYLTFSVRCSKGTYIRTLCHDLGQMLGCGAHMTALRRTATGSFDESMSLTPAAIEALIEQDIPLPLLSPAEALADWPAVRMERDVLMRLQDGIAPKATEVSCSGLVAQDRVRFLAGDDLVAIARFVPERNDNKPGDFKLFKVFPLNEGA